MWQAGKTIHAAAVQGLHLLLIEHVLNLKVHAALTAIC